MGDEITCDSGMGRDPFPKQEDVRMMSVRIAPIYLLILVVVILGVLRGPGVGAPQSLVVTNEDFYTDIPTAGYDDLKLFFGNLLVMRVAGEWIYLYSLSPTTDWESQMRRLVIERPK
jgi:hypothetical protein